MCEVYYFLIQVLCPCQTRLHNEVAYFGRSFGAHRSTCGLNFDTAPPCLLDHVISYERPAQYYRSQSNNQTNLRFLPPISSKILLSSTII